jgi:hypothetical protein
MLLSAYATRRLIGPARLGVKAFLKAQSPWFDDELSRPIIPIPKLTTFVLLLPRSFDLVTRRMLLKLTDFESSVDMHDRLIGGDDLALRRTPLKDERFNED